MDVLQRSRRRGGRRSRRAAADAGRAPGPPEGGVRARPDVPRDGAGGRLFRRAVRVAGGRRRARLRREARHRRARCASGSASATRPARWDALSSHLAAHKIPVVGPGAAGPGRRQRARPLRLLPRPRDAAGDRSPEAGDRLRRAAARSRGQGPQVRQLARVAALPQEGVALRPARRAGRDPPDAAPRSSSRATSTCSRCTRRASRRPSRRWARR